MSAHTHDNSSSTQIIVGAHYRVGKKIGEGPFGVIFEGRSPPSLHQLPELYLTCLHILGVNLLNSQSVAIKFVSDILLLLLRGPFFPFCQSDNSATLQEPRKAEVPHLRDEYRSYRILTGCGTLAFVAFVAWHNVALSS